MEKIPLLPSKNVCIYHKIDLDGKCSAAIVKHFRKDAVLYGMDHGDPFPWDYLKNPGLTVYMVDFSLPINEMLSLGDKCELVWIDHHITAIEAFKECKNTNHIVSLLDTQQAACELTWDFFSMKEVPYGVKMLGRYDVWDLAYHEDVINYQEGVKTLPHEPDNKDFWEPLFTCDHDETTYGFDPSFDEDIVYRGEIAITYQKSMYEQVVSLACFETRFEGLRCIACNFVNSGSRLFDSVPDRDEYDACVVFYRVKSGDWKISIYRINPDVKCGDIAKKYGGGGHDGAAGWTVNELPSFLSE